MAVFNTSEWYAKNFTDFICFLMFDIKVCMKKWSRDRTKLEVTL